MTFRHPLDPQFAEARIDMRLAQAEVAAKAAIQCTAEQWWSIGKVVDEARDHTEVFVPATTNEADRVEFAVRAAVADIAVRLGISEKAVREQAFLAQMLPVRMPRLWDLFLDGEVTVANVKHAAELLTSLPDDAADEFDRQIADVADQGAAKFRIKTRVIRDRIHSTPLAERAATARSKRGVWIENGLDGQADLILHGPAEVIHAGYARIDAHARALVDLPGETRTLAQLRFDTAGDLMLGNAGAAPRFDVAVTLPAATAAGVSDEPGTLEGYGLIDPDTARRIAAAAPTFKRLLTDPFTRAVIDIDAATYRTPAAMRRWLRVTEQYCSFPGCGRLARNSDLDHTVDHQHGGKTTTRNLAPLCRHHHRIKHNTRYTVVQNPPGAPSKLTWTSPTGHTTTSDPPPF